MKYRRKPIEVEASQWHKLGDHPAITQFAKVIGDPTPCKHCGVEVDQHGWVRSPAGGNIVCPGDWVITHADGGIETCKPGTFEQIYEPAGICQAQGHRNAPFNPMG